jgi:hypothetical protein
VQSHYGNQGNFELVVVLQTQQMQHFWRDNDNGMVWNAGPTFGSNISSPPYMIEGPYGQADENSIGNFELCVASQGQVQHWFRNNQSGAEWAWGATFGSSQGSIQQVVALIQGSYGFNLEMVVLLESGQLQHFIVAAVL